MSAAEENLAKILEALRVDDVVRVGVNKGSGKAALVEGVCRYIAKRHKAFKFENVFWLPPAHHQTTK